MSNTPTPAGLILMQAGLSGRELAEALGVTPQAVSYQLAGKTSDAATHPLLELIEERAGYAVASAVAEAIDRAREARASA